MPEGYFVLIFQWVFIQISAGNYVFLHKKSIFIPNYMEKFYKF